MAPSGVAVAAGVLRRDQALLPSDADANGAALRSSSAAARVVDLPGREVAEPPQQVGQRLGAPLPAGADRLDTSACASGSSRSPSSSWPSSSRSTPRSSGSAWARRSREGRVGLVHVVRDVVEEERGRERRAVRRLDLDQPDLRGAAGRASSSISAGEVEHVLQALAVRLEHDREDRVAAATSSDCALSRCCQSGVRWPGRRRGISSARAAFSRKRAPNSAVPPSSRTTRSSTASGSTARRRPAAASSASGRCSDDAVVRPDRVALDAERLAQARGQGQRPGRVHRPPNGVSTHRRQSPISSRKRSTTTVRSDGQTRRWPPAAREIDAEILAPLARRAAWSVDEAGPAPRRRRDLRAPERWPDRRAELYGRPTPSPFQNGTWPGDARRGGDEHAVARDLLDAPAWRRRAGTSGRPAPRRPSPRRARRRARRRRRGRRRRGRGRGSCLRS